MDFKIVSIEEVGEMIRQTNRERAAKNAATRRVRQWLERLYQLEDPRS